MKKAFTLIELLVVIAIIAILAAILFPVFAQAKEAAKKTSALSSIKQTSLGTLVYSTDADDLLPLGIAPRSSNGTWRYDSYNPIPAEWPGGGYAVDPAKSDFSMVWANSIFPYTKNADIYVATGTPDLKIAGAPYGAAGTTKWRNASFAFNGLLQSMSTTSVSQPSRLAMYSIGSGKATTNGFVDTLPVLACSGAGSCRFTPGGSPQAGVSVGQFGDAWFWNGSSAYVYSGGMHFAAADGSAKFTKLNGPAAAQTVLSERDPWNGYSAQGVPLGMWDCGTATDTVYYSCFFRPDNEFNNY